jgi:hypothetical protein
MGKISFTPLNKVCVFFTITIFMKLHISSGLLYQIPPKQLQKCVKIRVEIHLRP